MSKIYKIILLLLTILLTACSTERVVFHSFGFDVRGSVPAVKVLNYRYGTSNLIGTHPDRLYLANGHVEQSSHVSGNMTVGDHLYVKWKIKNTGTVYEKTVNLRNRLPDNIKDHYVMFYISGDQLYIYLIDPEFLPVGAAEQVPVDSPSAYLPWTYHRRYIMLYPKSFDK